MVVRPFGAARGRWLALVVVALALTAGLLGAREAGLAAHVRGRLHLADVSVRVAQGALPWGVGAGQLRSAFLAEQARVVAERPARLDLWTDAAHAHDEPLQAFAELGPLGLLLLVVPVVAALARPSPGPAFSVVVAFVVLGSVSLPLYEPATATLAALCTGLVLGAARRASPGARGRREPTEDDTRTGDTAARSARGRARLPAVADAGHHRRPIRQLIQHMTLAAAVAALALTSANVVADRLLSRGAARGSVELLEASALLSLAPERALEHAGAALLDRAPLRARLLADRAVERAPTVAGLVLVGSASMEAGEPARAVAAFERAVHLAPRLFAGHYDLALAHEALGDRHAARRHAARARSLRPTDPRLDVLPR